MVDGFLKTVAILVAVSLAVAGAAVPLHHASHLAGTTHEHHCTSGEEFHAGPTLFVDADSAHSHDEHSACWICVAVKTGGTSTEAASYVTSFGYESEPYRLDDDQGLLGPCSIALSARAPPHSA